MAWRRYLLFEYFLSGHPYTGVRTAGGESYIEYGNGDREYYDMRVDPWELHNAYGDPQNAERVEQLSQVLSTLKDCKAAGCRAADGGPP